MSSRLSYTLLFSEIVTHIGGKTLADSRTLLDQMSRWIMAQKKSDGSWGSTLDTSRVIRAMASMERITGDIRDTAFESTLSLDGKLLQKEKLDVTNRLQIFSTGLSLDSLKDSSNIHFEKVGK